MDYWSSYVIPIGAVLLTAVLTVATTSYFARLQHRQQRKSEAIAVALKATAIASNFDHLNQEFRTALNRHKGLNDPRRPMWVFVQQQAGRAESIKIEPHELLVFIEAKEYHTVQQLMTLGMRHKAICDASNEFSDLKDKLGARLTEGIIDKKMNIQTDQLDQQAQLIITQMTTLTASMANLLPTFDKEAKNLCHAMMPPLRKHLKDKNIPLLKVSD